MDSVKRYLPITGEMAWQLKTAGAAAGRGNEPWDSRSRAIDTAHAVGPDAATAPHPCIVHFSLPLAFAARDLPRRRTYPTRFTTFAACTSLLPPPGTGLLASTTTTSPAP